MLLIDRVHQRAEEFDILHFHIDLFHFPLFRSMAARTVTTLHGRQDLEDLKPFYNYFAEMPLVSIFNAQRKPIPRANLVATIRHGIPVDLHRPSFFGQGSYVAFLGRVSPEKRPDRAIRIARTAGMPLKIAAKVDKVDEDYFHSEIRTLIDGPGVEFIGEINEREKTKFLGEAAALPGGLAGAFWTRDDRSHGVWHPGAGVSLRSIPEMIDDGVTGKVVDSEKDAIAAVREIMSYNRGAVRQRFEERFISTKMAKGYVSTYRKLLRERTTNSKERSMWAGQLDLKRGNGLSPHVD
jgi:glycosyltransferase involved in cell wall biosynthesis